MCNDMSALSMRYNGFLTPAQQQNLHSKLHVTLLPRFTKYLGVTVKPSLPEKPELSRCFGKLDLFSALSFPKYEALNSVIDENAVEFGRIKL